MHFRTSVRLLAATMLCAGSVPLLAQTRESIPEVASETSAPDNGTIDILAEPGLSEIDQRRIEECERQNDAATISGEIVVCREIVEDTAQYYSGDREAAQRRYAEETAFRDDPATPNPCGPMCGIFTGPPTVGGLCIPGLQKCPPPPALIFDITALPEAPPGSDADRIARGLPPIGNDTGTEPNAQDLPGLPQQPDEEAAAAASEDPKPEESAEPAAER
jgi:hypothetical protein